MLGLLLATTTTFGEPLDVNSAFSEGTAQLAINTDGSYTSTGSDDGDWLSIPALAPYWEVRATLTSGSLATGTVGTWLATTSQRTWSVTGGNQTAEITLEWREVHTGLVKHTQTGISLVSQTI